MLTRLRVWDYLLSAGGPPDREIVHSHDFNRYLTPFRAEWDPTDDSERRVVVGRWCKRVLISLFGLFLCPAGRSAPN